MADKIRVWVRFSEAVGYERETKHEAIMQRVDEKGHVIGFSVLGVSRFKQDKPLAVDLTAA
jgi:hypothetical protein